MHVLTDPRQVQTTDCPLNLVGEVGQHLYELSTNGPLAPQAQDHRRTVSAFGRWQQPLQRSRAGVKEVAVDVQQRHLLARKPPGWLLLRKQPVWRRPPAALCSSAIRGSSISCFIPHEGNVNESPEDVHDRLAFHLLLRISKNADDQTSCLS